MLVLHKKSSYGITYKHDLMLLLIFDLNQAGTNFTHNTVKGLSQDMGVLKHFY